MRYFLHPATLRGYTCKIVDVPLVDASTLHPRQRQIVVVYDSDPKELQGAMASSVGFVWLAATEGLRIHRVAAAYLVTLLQHVPDSTCSKYNGLQSAASRALRRV